MGEIERVGRTKETYYPLERVVVGGFAWGRHGYEMVELAGRSWSGYNSRADGGVTTAAVVAVVAFAMVVVVEVFVAVAEEKEDKAAVQ